MMMVLRRLVFILCVLVMVGGALPAKAAEPTKDDIVASILSSQEWLTNFQREGGLYYYIFRPWGYDLPSLDLQSLNTLPGVYLDVDDNAETYTPYPDSDNIVRQILSYWALIKTLDYRDTDAARASIEKFEHALDKLIVIEDSEHGSALFVRNKEMQKVNSTALYLAALIEKEARGLPLSDTQKKHIDYSVNGLKVFAAPALGFYYYHNTNKLNFITSYGSGEAQYALAKYINRTGDVDLYEWADRLFRKYFEVNFKPYFSKPSTFTDRTRVGYFTWGVYYLNEIDKFRPIDYETYARPLIKFAMEFKKINPQCGDKPCIYSMAMWDSSSVEAMTAAYELMMKYETDAELIGEVKDYLDASIAYLLSLQVTDVAQYEDITGRKFTNDPKHLIGGFCDWPKCHYMRNEVSMHVTTAMMNYLRVRDMQPTQLTE